MSGASEAPSENPPRWCVVGRAGDGGRATRDGRGDEDRLAAVDVFSDGRRSPEIPIAAGGLPEFVAAREGSAGGAPRWVWHDTAARYPSLLAAGVRVARCHDLRLCHQILRSSARTEHGTEPLADERWSAAAVVDAGEPQHHAEDDAPTLFEVDELGDPEVRPAPPGSQGAPDALEDALLEFERQRALLGALEDSGRLSLLLAAESAGALVAAELTAAGVPWDAQEHDRILTEALGPRPEAGSKPREMLELAETVRGELGDAAASLDSPPKLLRALRSAGIEVSSTSRWELAEHEHPAIAPLLHYKKLARLLTANGWAWLDEWVRDGRYRPVYVPGGVVTGRWASSGGGALQIPRRLRPALRADPGWVLVSADVSQLEPRVLAAMSGDRAMAAAGRGTDLYAGLVERGVVETRQEAKIAMLGAMYGSTTGESGRLVPRLRRAFPAAMGLVDAAAAVGEQGGVVSTWLGRRSPRPGAEWSEIQAAAMLPGATRRDEELARRVARDRGRFTRNFVVQGTAAEWALAWMADLRARLADFDPVPADRAARASGPVFERRPHLAFFLHDEVIVHAPQQHVEAVEAAVRAAAEAAGRTLFGPAPVDFPLDLRSGARASKE